ncbi:MAG: hypothetical protein A3H72_01900 [Candidatus Doudnabacteria bacterium RIFCSPLOWO2_02_FULL_48_8]|uniref:Transcriptional repressor PaaX-like central Cas2-like domain-containing protein n=1 Tax=Candidatus Doudnabacteria bacterium RIFCSPHIGHO2_01_FULL_46_24 TaxID=1817825 RepID=A0A1F5NT70_9BACT|nr:MAG: hypothetical protein A2720_04695 [Candidatus Doudnabacteria bacterium RIFCSPHIGHO2_01_FULL_46_24]OGE95283.1 MAG: hypothetical protein A3H72_01900 [Candidatus Doudnabacteria bacterium RIFCSPLOWO2_02_FULL_48_8]OGE95849.1 MAG: hypothetical protein A3E98_01645 [Candidatus Doudnabacteria bacterium RIFCSPHIGHO2_12_FULL_48_11]
MKAYEKTSLRQAVKEALPRRKIELTERQIQGLKTASKIILALALIAGAVSLAIVAPNAVRLLNSVSGRRGLKSKEFNAKQKQRVLKSVYYLKQQKDVELIPQGKNFLLKVTQKGRSKLRSINFQNLHINKPDNWDKTWWMVLADIPTKTHKSGADQLRRKLKEIGFYSLQRTVWAYPYDPRDEVDFITNYYDLSKFVTVIQVSLLDPSDEQTLRQYFKNIDII